MRAMARSSSSRTGSAGLVRIRLNTNASGRSSERVPSSSRRAVGGRITSSTTRSSTPTSAKPTPLTPP